MSDTTMAQTVSPEQGHSVAPSSLISRLDVPQGLLDGAVTPSRIAPMTASFANRRLTDVRMVRNGEIVTVELNAEVFKEMPTKRDARIARRFDKDKAMQDLLGPVVRFATNLQLTTGEMIEACRDLQGRIVRWDWWAPAKRMLISRFRTYNEISMDDEQVEKELEHRYAWCNQNKIDWLIAPPNMPKFSLADIRLALADEAALTQV